MHSRRTYGQDTLFHRLLGHGGIDDGTCERLFPLRDAGDCAHGATTHGATEECVDGDGIGCSIRHTLSGPS